VLRVIEVPVAHYVRQLDELSSAQPRHVIERLITTKALRQIEAEVAQIEAQVAKASEQVEPIPEPVAEPPLPEPRPMSARAPHDDGVIVMRPPKLSHRFPKPPSL
jgi:hypothetical protein